MYKEITNQQATVFLVRITWKSTAIVYVESGRLCCYSEILFTTADELLE